jgi:hypothetical protein
VSRTFLTGIVAAALLALPAHAMSKRLDPEREEYVSANGAFRLTVDPRPAGSACVGRLDRKTADGGWELAWEAPLRNPTALGTAAVSDSGRFVATFDDWDGRGYGPRVVVVYGPDGKAIRELSLLDLLTPAEIDALPRTAGSIYWGRRHHRFEGDERLVLRITSVPPDAARFEDLEYFPVTIHLPGARVLRGDTALAAIAEGKAFCAAIVAIAGDIERNGSCRREHGRAWCYVCLRSHRP